MVPPAPHDGPIQVYAELKAELDELERMQREIQEQRALLQERLRI